MNAFKIAALTITAAACACSAGGHDSGNGVPPAAMQARSWMTPGAKSGDLLYVTDEGNYNVYVYDYPTGTLVGTLVSAYGSPTGLCVDKKGDVFVTEYNGQEVLVYAHGGTTPIRSLYDAGQPIGCAIDRVTGDLAVANEMNATGAYGNISIFKKARGTGTVLQDLPSLELPYWCAYDNKGDLFVDGEYNQSGWHFTLAELAAHTTTFTNISVPDGAGTPPGDLGWDGKHLTVGSASSQNGLIFRFNVAGSSATLAGTTMLSAYNRMPAYFLAGGRVVATSGSDIGLFKYPKGGAPLTQFTQNYPWSTAVSKAH